MALVVNPAMITVAREARRMTQGELAGTLGVSQGKVSKWEAGLLGVSDEDLDALSRALRFRRTFFFQDGPVYGVGSSCLYHRKRQSLQVSDYRTLLALMNIFRLQCVSLLRGIEIDSRLQVPRLDIADFDGSAEDVARLVRGMWQLPSGPIANLTGLIESAGGIVIAFNFKTDKLDAVSQWPAGGPPLFFANGGVPSDRLRYTLAHELGHVVMHTVPTSDLEAEADRFAAEFLMPAKDIAHELTRFSLEKAFALKTRWRVSAAALIRRARDLGKITPTQYRRMFTRLGSLGYRRVEPNPIELEVPQTLRRLLDVHTKEHGYSIAELAALTHLDESEFVNAYLPEQNDKVRAFRPVP